MLKVTKNPNWCSNLTGVLYIFILRGAKYPFHAARRTGNQPVAADNGAGLVSEEIKGSARVPLLRCFSRCTGRSVIMMAAAQA